MLGMEKNEMCEECQAANRKSQIIGLGGGLLLGAGLCFVVLKFVSK
jgi:hypothetical protein